MLIRSISYKAISQFLLIFLITAMILFGSSQISFASPISDTIAEKASNPDRSASILISSHPSEFPFFEDFNSSELDVLPTGWTLLEASAVQPKVIETDGQRSLKFPAAQNTSSASFLMVDGLPLPAEFSLVTKINFLESDQGKAGVAFGVDANTGSALAIYIDRATGSVETVANPNDPATSAFQTLSSNPVSIEPNRDQWLSIVVSSTESGSRMDVSWSLDGITFEPIYSADTFTLLPANFALSTAGETSPAVIFDDVSVTTQSAPINPIPDTATLPANTATSTSTSTLVPTQPLTATPEVSANIITINAIPAAFSKVSPLNAATGQGTSTLTLTWGASTEVTSYEICYNKTSTACTATSTNWITAGTATSKEITGLSNAVTYYWQVRAVNSFGATYANGTVTNRWSFKTGAPAAFVKTAPLNAASYQSLSTTISWATSSGATRYETCYATSASTCTNWVTNGTSTSRTLTGLTNGLTYYWHVRAINNVGTTYSNASSTPWSFNTGSPAPFNKTAPTTASTGQPGNVTLSWAASTGATSYEVCKYTTTPADCDVTTGNWTTNGTATSLALSSLTGDTTYYWHVRAVNGAGITYSNGSALTFWSFTTGVPLAFNKSAVIDGAANQPKSVTLSWTASVGTSTYEVCYDATDDDACSSWLDNGTATSIVLNNRVANTTYFWQVRAKNNFGDTYGNGSESAFWSFTTNPPAAFTKTSVADASAGQPTSLTLAWAASTGATSYDFCYDTTNDNACTTWSTTGAVTSKSLTGLITNTTYYWQVRANNGFDPTYANGSPTAFWSFRTGAPLAFNKVSPATGSTGYPLNTVLSWSASSGATKYEVCFDKTNDNKCSTWVNNGTATSRTLTGLVTNTLYYWQVRAVNALGTTYANASTTSYWSIKTGVPAAFVKSAPATGSTGQPLQPTISWVASSGADRYEVCYDASNDNACTTWVNNGTSTSKVLSDLTVETTYYWQVRAVNSLGTTYANASTTNFWSVKPGVPNVFSKTSPSNAATGQSGSVVLSWAASSGSTGYEVCYDASDDGECDTWHDTGTTTSYTATGLTVDTTYYWQVRANNSVGSRYGNSGQSDYWSFSTSVPAGFAKSAIANGSTGQSSTPTLSWAASAGATSYDVCVATNVDSGCSPWVTNGSATSKTLSGLVAGTTYYWQVKAKNSFGASFGNGSETAYWTFTTGTPSAFNKLTPLHLALGQPAAAILTWQAVSGATKYEVCFNKSATACTATSTGWVATGTTTTKTLSGLSKGIKYYWQVRATNGFGTTYANGAVTNNWAFTTGLPTSFTKSAPLTGALNQPVKPTISWSTSSGVTNYQYCFDTTNDGKCTTWVNNGTNTSVAIGDLLANTLYYWHVRAVNNWGTVYSNNNSSTAFVNFKTGILPTAFNKSAVANGSSGHSVNLTLSWASATGFDHYEYCYDTTNDNTCAVWQDNGTATSVALSNLSADSTYYWQVRAVNSIGSSYGNGSATTFWSFTIGALPATFSKSAPTKAATNQSFQPTLSWAASSGATKYWVCYDTSNDNTCSTWVDNGSATSKALSGLAENTTYYWHVKATNSVGTRYSNGSLPAFWSFTTGSLPAAFAKTTLTNGTTGQPNSVTLTWAASTYATSYEVCYDITDDDTCTGWTSTGTDTSIDLTDLAADTTYYWQVKAINIHGTTFADGSASADWSFATDTLPTAFSKTTPTESATGQPESLTLTWAASGSASNYEVCYGTTDSCSSWIDVDTDTSYDITGLPNATTYYWQVRASNTFGYTYANGSAPASWSFTTGAPAAFGKSDPVDESTGQSDDPTLTWLDSSGATNYQYCIDLYDDNNCSWIDNGTDTSIPMEALEKDTTYYWHVKASNNFGTTYADGSGTAFWSFNTGVPSQFNKLTILDGATGLPANPTLTWEQSFVAKYFEVCYDTTDDNACTTWHNAGKATSLVLSGLSADTTYYWQVRAVNNYGTTYSNLSETSYWSFTTGSFPSTFYKIALTDGVTGVPFDVTLSWGLSTYANKYQYCYDKTDDDACSTWVDNGTNTSISLTNLDALTTYYWHARAVNSFGNTYGNGTSTAFWSFRTGSLPLSFAKTAPTNAIVSRPSTVTLTWDASSGATSYEYCYDDTNDTTCSPWVDNGTATSKELSGLTINKTYYWQVKAINNVGTTYGNDSSTTFWSFTTGVPAAFNKTAVANGATGQSSSVTLTWAASTGASSYEYCYDTSNDNACAEPWIDNGSDTSAVISGLTGDTTYYWQVRAVNSFGNAFGNGSDIAYWTFTTGAPGAFSKGLPANAANGQTSSPTLSWLTSSGATNYEACYYIDDPSDCDEVTGTWTNNATDISLGLSDLPTDTTFYWQVRAKNAFGTTYGNGSYNAFWSFHTGTPSPYASVQQKIAAGDYHTCAVVSGGAVKCWGLNSFGQLGNAEGNSLQPKTVSGITGAISVSAGSWHSCALFSNGTVKCWGLNTLGVGFPVSGIDTAVAITSGREHTCALLDGGAIKCWGQNGSGQLGNNSILPSSNPVSVSGISTATSITAGTDHTCATLVGGSIKCWGYNNKGQLGDGSFTNRLVPVSISGTGTYTSVTAAETHTCALMDTGSVKCWGNNEDGQLGNGTTSITPTTTPTLVPGISDATLLEAGGNHTCVKLVNNTMKCWGNYFFGQDDLDQDINIYQYSPTAITGLTGIPVSITSGHDHSCVIQNNRSIQCFGANKSGQLGFDNSLDPVNLTPVTVMDINNALTTYANPNLVCFQQSNGKNQCWDGNIYSLATPKEGRLPQG